MKEKRTMNVRWLTCLLFFIPACGPSGTTTGAVPSDGSVSDGGFEGASGAVPDEDLPPGVVRGRVLALNSYAVRGARLFARSAAGETPYFFA